MSATSQARHELTRADGQPETRRLERCEGTSFALHLFPAAEPRGPAILIEPAMGVQAGYYSPLAQALADAGYHTGVAEVRGHEETGGRRPGWRYDFGYHEMLTEDWPLAVQAMRARFPESPLYLLGHSLGGQISSIYASHHPQQLAGLILIACCSVYWRLWSKRFLLSSLFIGQIGRLLGHFPGRRLGFAGREARSLMADWARQARTGHYAFGRPRVDHDRHLATLALPVLAISIRGDWLAHPKAVDGLLAKFPHADLSRHHIDPNAMGLDGIDHFRWARKPESVLPTIRGWLGPGN